jgi:type IV secretion system protein VirB4
MFPELSYASSSALVTTAIGTILGLASAAGIGLVLAPRIAQKILPQPKETRLAEYLPFDAILPDGRTVTCRDGTHCRFVAIRGIDQAFLNPSEEGALYLARKKMIDAFAETGVTLRIFTFRDSFRVRLDGDYPNKYAQEVAERWNANFKRAFQTRTVLIISTKESDSQKLDELVNLVETTLAPYQPMELTQNPDASPDKDLTIGALLGRIVSPLSRPAPNAFGEYLSDAIAADEVEFLKNGRIVFRSADRVKYASVIGIRRLGDSVNTQLTNELNSMAAEMVILQTVEPQPKAKSLLFLRQQQRMVAGTSFSSEVAAQYEDIMRMVEGLDDDKAALCYFSEVVFLFADSEEELKEVEQECRKIMTKHGITSVIEKGATQASWFMQFPTYDTRPRIYKLVSHNVAVLATFDRPPSGLPRSDWGPGPISMFYTGSNTVYSHQFHISTEPMAVGHGLCIAPTGVGKTTLMTFLSCMSSRHRNLRHFLFDRFQGTYVYTTAMGGQYLSFNAEKLTKSVIGGMNPLQCERTDDNYEFLRNWLKAISGCDDHDSIDQISQALDIAFSTLDDDERSLAAIYDGAFTPGSAVREALEKWVDPSQYGSMFNAEKDAIDLDDNWLTTFDMTNLLSDEMLGAASVMYIMHRIRQTLRKNRAPGFIFIDETEPLLRDPNFKTIYLVMLQEFRKLGGVIVSVFQRPEALRSSGISELVRQQCGTYYLFPNPGATAEDYSEFDLTQRELGFILGHTELARTIKRGLLIKRPMTKESVIVDIDLGCLGPYLKIFSSSARDVALVSDLQRQFRTGWVERYIDYEAP